MMNTNCSSQFLIPFAHTGRSHKINFNNIAQWQKGEIFEIEGKRLQGMMKIQNECVLYKEKNMNSAIKININKVDSIQINAYDSSISNCLKSTFVKFPAISKSKFWRRIFSGKINLYDDSILSNEMSGFVNYDRMLIEKTGVVNEVVTFWTTTNKRGFVKQINKKLNQKLVPRNFPNCRSLLYWLKNNETIQS